MKNNLDLKYINSHMSNYLELQEIDGVIVLKMPKEVAEDINTTDKTDKVLEEIGKLDDYLSLVNKLIRNYFENKV